MARKAHNKEASTEQAKTAPSSAPDDAFATLTAKEALFVREYLIDYNGTQAYLRAFPGGTKGSAGVSANRLLKNPKVAAAIEQAREKTAQSLELTREDVIRQYQRLGFSDTRKLYDAYGQIKPIHDLDDDTAAAVQGIEVEMRMIDGPDNPPVPVLKVKLADRKGALDSIMRAQGWNMPDKMEHTGKGGGPIEHAVRVVLVPPKQKAEVQTKRIERHED